MGREQNSGASRSRNSGYYSRTLLDERLAAEGYAAECAGCRVGTWSNPGWTGWNRHAARDSVCEWCHTDQQEDEAPGSVLHL
ncbi:hypothetical protein D3C75_1118580 [compost metagenome]